MPYKDKEKKLKWNKKWALRNKAKRREYQRLWNKANRNKIGLWYKEYKRSLKCSRCPETFFACLEFHHPKKDKTNLISRMVGQGCSIESIKKEMSKCIVLCSNCHRKEHWKLGLLV